MTKPKQLDLENRTDLIQKQKQISRPQLWSSVCPYRHDVPYEDDLPSLTRQEFAPECDVNQIMKNYEATGIMPISNREPIYWDSDAVPDNLQDAMGALNYANELFMQLPAHVRKEFDNDAVAFVNFASDRENLPKLKEWGLTAPETPPAAPMRVEVVTPPASPPPAPPGGPLPVKTGV